MNAAPTEENQSRRMTMTENQFYELYLQIGNVAHWLGNGCDPDHAAEELELIMEKLREKFP